MDVDDGTGDGTGDVATGVPDPSFRLVYRSRIRIAPDRRDAELDAIFRTARRRNAAVRITGALLVWRDVFVQLLEGDEGAVRSLYARLHADPRHRGLVLLDADTVPDRVFPRWSMARVSDDRGDDVPVDRDRQEGRHPEPRPALDDPRQRMMVDLMRDYARPDVRPC